MTGLSPKCLDSKGVQEMISKAEEAKRCLPVQSYRDFDDIVNQKVLGASKHISMIGEMIENITMDGLENKDQKIVVIDRIITVCDYFIQTRGEASQAVSNAIHLMTKGIEALRNGGVMNADVAKEIIKTKENYALNSTLAIKKVVGYAVNLATKYNNIFVYDYSSTVDKFLKHLSDDGKKRTVYIAESRIINGGYPFVLTCQESGYDIKFVPDASMMYAIRKCDACFMGAETFYPDGTGFNTTGSDIVGLICNTLNIPLYFLTPMIKLDTRPIIGKEKNTVYNDVRIRLSHDWDHSLAIDKIDFVTPELIGVPPEHIKAFVTEFGVVPSIQMYGLSMEYSKSLKEEN